MKKYACRYAIVRFLPYPETEEFANIGIVLTCPETGYFGFKLQKRRHGRVTNFFDEVKSKTYREALAMFDKELARINEDVYATAQQPDELRSIFGALVHPREAIIRFSESRSRLVDHPEDALEQLFRYYVERDFVTHEYKEQVLERRIRTLVHGLKLVKPFRAMNLGDEYTVAHFPLVQADGGTLVKAIKPFYLNQSDPSKIITHGGLWVDRIKRLRKRNLLPEAVLFAVDGPSEDAGKRYFAYKEICEDLEGYEIQIVPTFQEQRIVDFAVD